MTCRHVQSLLSAYLDGELGGEQMLAIRHHLHGCPACEQELAELRRVKQLLEDWAPVEPPSGLEERLVHLIGRSEPTPRRWNFRWALAGAAAAAALTVGLIAVNRVGTSPRTLAQGPAAERTLEELYRDQTLFASSDPLAGRAPIVQVSFPHE